MFTNVMNENLSAHIIEEELGKVVKSMAKGKAPGHDGIPMEFFQKLWHIVGNEYHQMILQGSKFFKGKGGGWGG